MTKPPLRAIPAATTQNKLLRQWTAGVQTLLETLVFVIGSRDGWLKTPLTRL